MRILDEITKGKSAGIEHLPELSELPDDIAGEFRRSVERLRWSCKSKRAFDREIKRLRIRARIRIRELKRSRQRAGIQTQRQRLSEGR